MVVDADHQLAFTPTHEVSHPFVILKRKVHAITSGLPVRRVHMVEVRTPRSGKELKTWKAKAAMLDAIFYEPR